MGVDPTQSPALAVLSAIAAHKPRARVAPKRKGVSTNGLQRIMGRAANVKLAVEREIAHGMCFVLARFLLPSHIPFLSQRTSAQRGR
jgi:hypothetical protein